MRIEFESLERQPTERELRHVISRLRMYKGTEKEIERYEKQLNNIIDIKKQEKKGKRNGSHQS